MPLLENTIQACLFELEVNTTLKGLNVPVESEPLIEEEDSESILEFKPPSSVLKKREALKIFEDEHTLRNTRSMKRKIIEQELNFDAKLDEINEQGSSMLKYEFVAKGNKKVLLAKRCSKRNQCLGIQQAPIDIDMSFEYQPRPIEDLFAKDALTEKVRIQKGVNLKISDIQAILGSLSP